MYDKERYNLSEVARYIGNKKIGRTKIYIILRNMGIVDDTNRPIQKYIDHGYVSVGRSCYYINGRLNHVTLAVGVSGMNFIDRVVKYYLRDHPVPKVCRRT